MLVDPVNGGRAIGPVDPAHLDALAFGRDEVGIFQLGLVSRLVLDHARAGLRRVVAHAEDFVLEGEGHEVAGGAHVEAHCRAGRAARLLRGRVDGLAHHGAHVVGAEKLPRKLRLVRKLQSLSLHVEAHVPDHFGQLGAARRVQVEQVVALQMPVLVELQLGLRLHRLARVERKRKHILHSERDCRSEC